MQIEIFFFFLFFQQTVGFLVFLRPADVAVNEKWSLRHRHHRPKEQKLQQIIGVLSRCAAESAEHRKKNHKLDNICPADFKKLNNSDARIQEILERYYWRDRVFPRDNLVLPFYYRVRWSVEGERELIPHEKLLDYCTQETLNTFNRRFCRDCGLDSGTNPETDHRFCPNKIRSTPTKRTGSESYIKKLLERHY